MCAKLVRLAGTGLTSLALTFTALSAQTLPARTLGIYVIDVEGGQATLFVSPSRESLLVNTGFPGDRDAGRIFDVMKEAGVQQLDHLLMTHYHVDHVGNVQNLAGGIPIKHFYDHGATAEPDREQVPGLQKAYTELSAKIPRTSLKAEDKIPFVGVDWRIVISAMNRSRLRWPARPERESRTPAAPALNRRTPRRIPTTVTRSAASSSTAGSARSTWVTCIGIVSST